MCLGLVGKDVDIDKMLVNVLFGYGKGVDLEMDVKVFGLV